MTSNTNEQKAANLSSSDDVEGGEALTAQVFSSFHCTVDEIRRRCKYPHPGNISEASSLAAVKLPPSSYPLWDSLPSDLIDNGKLSQLQLEGVLYACTQHQNILPSGERAGFFIGDGAGMGKGRQISGIIIDNFCRGRRKHIWVSISSDLHIDANRDLKDLGCHVNIINGCTTLDKESKTLNGLSKDFQEGILFLTYSTLTSSAKGKSRMTQVVEWLGGSPFDGVLVFDECHKAKNSSGLTSSSNDRGGGSGGGGSGGGGTKVAAAVIELQSKLPMARVLYCSATGVSEVSNMHYLTRMGLWGPDTAFPSFDIFLESMKRRGVSFMEMLAMEMKAEGRYLARGLGFRDANFEEVEAGMEEGMEEIYDKCARLWRSLHKALTEAEPLMTEAPQTNTKIKSLQAVKSHYHEQYDDEAEEEKVHAASKSGPIKSKGDVWKAFYSTQQRFFKLLTVSMKVPLAIREAKEAMSHGMCVVIGLQTTGESASEALDLMPGQQVAGFISPCREMLRRFVETCFPAKVPSDLDLNSKHSSELVQIKIKLLEVIEAMKLPGNFLDVLIDELGGPNKVAEMTGRRARIVRSGGGGRFVYELRGKVDSAEMDSLNVTERDAFQAGKKLIAIISDAASTGISLHSSLSCKNQRRRVHITIELPWSADKAIQQLGRTHRTNQANAPLYKLLVTKVGGEKRFASAVARRLQSLGALTRGDRRAASGLDLSSSNLDTPLGNKSLKKLYDCLVLDPPTLPSGVTLRDIYQNHPDALVVMNLDQSGHAMDRVAALHERLREHCVLMGVGLGSAKRRDDSSSSSNAANEGPPTSATGSKDQGDVKRFLNRILGIELSDQSLLFNYFVAILTGEIKLAKAEGKYSEGLSDLHGRSVNLLTTTKVWTDPLNTNLATLAHIFSIDRGISWMDARRRLEHELLPGDLHSGFRKAKRPVHASASILLAIKRPTGGGKGGGGGHGEKGGGYAIYRPGTGVAGFDMDQSDLDAKYFRPMPYETDPQVELDWSECYESALNSCIHGSNCQHGSDCMIGRRLSRVAILSGSVVRVWGTLEAILSKYEMRLSRAERNLRVVRVEISDLSTTQHGTTQQPSSSSPHLPAPSPSAAAHGVNGVIGGPSSHVVGVRFPEFLISEVVQTLATAQQVAAGLKQQQVSMASYFNPGGLGGGVGGLKGGCTKTETPSPIQVYSTSKAFTKPKQITDFFKPKTSQQEASVTQLEISTSLPLNSEIEGNNQRGAAEGAGKGGGVKAKDKEADGKKKSLPSLFKLNSSLPSVVNGSRVDQEAGKEKEKEKGSKAQVKIPSVLHAPSSKIPPPPPTRIEYISLDDSQENNEGGGGGKMGRGNDSSIAPPSKKQKTKEEDAEVLMKLCGVDRAEASRTLFLTSGDVERAADIILQSK